MTDPQPAPRRNPGNIDDLPRRPGLSASLAGYALVVGAIAGAGAIAFRLLIALFHNLMFFGRFDLHYDALQHTPESSWGAGVVLVPVAGALAVAFLVRKFAPEAKGHGVPEVIDAINWRAGIIRPRVALIKSLASSISIGSGGAVGREGPIIQIGATFGSVMAQWMNLPIWQRITLIAAGAGGGIAATFNTPIGGLLFAVEIVLVEISARTLIPVMIATGAASYIGCLYFGSSPSFVIPSLIMDATGTLSTDGFLSFAILGLIVGLLAFVYARAIYAFEDFFDALPGNYYTRHTLGMTMVGILMYLLMQNLGHYYIQGVGYATIQDILDGQLQAPGILLLLVALKLLAVSLTLGSGASGGIFSPALFMGAALGAGLAGAANTLAPALALDAVNAAVIGMACMIAASTGAAVTAVVMIFEMTRDYSVVIPTIIAVSLAYAVRHWLIADNIYTLKLSRRGRRIPPSIQSHLYLTHKALELVRSPFVLLENDATIASLPARHTAGGSHPHVVLTNSGTVSAVVSANTLNAAVRDGETSTPLRDLADARHCIVDAETRVIDVLGQLRRARCHTAVIVRKRNSAVADSPDTVAGVVSWGDIADAANLSDTLKPDVGN